ncbi:Hypothetical predicted protein [Scomber scombrus]|uniref:Uncharacterized protein n=1 Tax=Scomber scombrus TaxID=13677 RepID=A0AAV1PQQ4_SCOSC
MDEEQTGPQHMEEGTSVPPHTSSKSCVQLTDLTVKEKIYKARKERLQINGSSESGVVTTHYSEMAHSFTLFVLNSKHFQRRSVCPAQSFGRCWRDHQTFILTMNFKLYETSAASEVKRLCVKDKQHQCIDVSSFTLEAEGGRCGQCDTLTVTCR